MLAEVTNVIVATPEALTTWATISYIVAGGFLGGFALGMYRVWTSRPQDQKKCECTMTVSVGEEGSAIGSLFKIILQTIKNICHIIFPRIGEFCFVFSSSLVGIAGAFGLAAMLCWVSKFKAIDTPEGIVEIIGVSVVGGYGGCRLLAKLAEDVIRKLERDQKELAAKVDEAERIAVRTGEVVNQQADAIHRVTDLMPAISEARRALSTGNPADIDRAIGKMEGLVKEYPMERSVFMILGCLHRAKKDYDTAIRVLRTYVANLRSYIDAPDVEINMADARYNIACYHAKLIQDMGDDDRKEKWRNEVIEELQYAIRHNPRNKEAAQDDEDFDGLREDPDFIGLVGEKKT